jgi:hypothetical protein
MKKKNSRNALVLVLSVLFNLNLYAQFVAYKSYEDYTKGKGTNYEDYLNYRGTEQVTLILKQGNEKVKLDCEDIWGFTYKDKLFRVTQDEAIPVCLLNNGKISYYEMGIVYLEAMKKEPGSVELQNMADYFFFSVDLKSEIIDLPILTNKKSFKEFKSAHPEYKSLFDCIATYMDPSLVRNCVNTFNKKYAAEEEE